MRLDAGGLPLENQWVVTQPTGRRHGARRRLRRARGLPAAICLVAVVGFGAACGGGSAPGGTNGGSPTSPASSSGTATAGTSLSSADIQLIRSNWTLFFDGSADPNQKVGLLQNGQAFADVIRLQAAGPLALGSSATISDVSFLAPGRAKVVYTILVDRKPALSNQIGLSVLEDGTWKVADASFCALLTLEGSKTPLCAAPSASASPTA
jgi:hypothetical protein